MFSLFFHVLLFSPVTFAYSRHTHPRRLAHKHIHRLRQADVRQADVSTTTNPSSRGDVSSADAVIGDVHEIENGVGALPQDIADLSFGLDQRLQRIEAQVARLFATSSLYSELAVTPTPACPTNLSPSESGPMASEFTTTPALYTPPLSQLSPSELHTTLHTTETITSTLHYTVTVYPSIPASSVSSNASSLDSDTWNAYQTVHLATTSRARVVSVPSTTSTTLMPISTSPFAFRYDSRANVAVYYGQTANTSAGGLTTLCQSPDVDIINLAFVTDFFRQHEQPTINFGPACDPPTAAHSAAAPGLLDCTRLGSAITTCQRLGKKVLVSLGGYVANTSFTSDQQARELAKTLWTLFGADTTASPALRPFGPGVTVDGFDIDPEQKAPAHYAAFASALRTYLDSDKTKRYYLSAAPQCPIPDQSIPLELMRLCDFVWVQFYNNPACNLDSANFKSSFDEWSKLLTSETRPGAPRLYIGVPAFPGAGSGYVEGSALASFIAQVRDLKSKNFGGVMMWDGTAALENVDQTGESFLQYAKTALQY